MDFIEVNKEKKKIILLIHPLGFSAEAMKNLIGDKLPADCRYIMPELAGQGNSKEIFKSTEVEAKKIEKYLLESKISEVDLAFGASLGGLVLLDLLKTKKIKFKKCIFEGCPLSEGSKLKELLARKFVKDQQKRALRDRNYGLEKIGELYGGGLANSIVDSILGLDKKSLINIVASVVHGKIPTIPREVQENCIFCYGSLEYNLKESRRLIAKKLPHVKIKIWKGFNHCEILARKSSYYCRFLEGELG